MSSPAATEEASNSTPVVLEEVPSEALSREPLPASVSPVLETTNPSEYPQNPPNEVTELDRASVVIVEPVTVIREAPTIPIENTPPEPLIVHPVEEVTYITQTATPAQQIANSTVVIESTDAVVVRQVDTLAASSNAEVVPSRVRTATLTSTAPTTASARAARKSSKLVFVESVSDDTPYQTTHQASSPYDDPNLGSPVMEQPTIVLTKPEVVVQPNVQYLSEKPPTYQIKHVHIIEPLTRPQRIRQKWRILLMKIRQRKLRVAQPDDEVGENYQRRTEVLIRVRRRDRLRDRLPNCFSDIILGSKHTGVLKPLLHKTAHPEHFHD